MANQQSDQWEQHGMAHFRGEQLQEQLQFLRRRSPSVIGSLVLSTEGLPIAADLPDEAEEERTAAKSAAMLSLGERIAGELRRGDLSQIFLSGSGGHVVVALVNTEAALTVLCQEDARVAMVLLDIDYSVEQLRRLL